MVVAFVVWKRVYWSMFYHIDAAVIHRIHNSLVKVLPDATV